MIDPFAVETLSLSAWPALETFEDDGWLWRFSGGYTKRANAVTPLQHGRDPLEAKVERAVGAYLARDMRPIFRLPDCAADTVRLEPLLAGRGWARVDLTLVLARPLANVAPSPAGAGAARLLPLEDWVDRFHALQGSEPHPLHYEIISRAAGERLPLVLVEREEVVACGLGLVDGGTLGVFDVLTTPGRRREGHGRRLMAALLALGAKRGAAFAFLQVMVANRPALALYDQLGFATIYRYHYRVAPEPPFIL